MAYSLRINGQKVARKEFFKGAPKDSGLPMINNAYKSHRPLESVAMSVPPHQAGMLRDKLNGIPGANVNPEGSVTFETRGARRAAMRRCGFVDRDGTYGDG